MKTITNAVTGEVQTFTDEEFVKERDRLLLVWENSKKALDVAKAAEMEARKAVVAFAFDPEKESGTERIELHNGYQAKAVKKLNYGWIKGKDDKTDRKAIDAALDRLAKAAGPAGEYIADNLVKWNPELSLTEYKKLDDGLKKIIDKVIVTSDGAPQLEIVPPKGQK